MRAHIAYLILYLLSCLCPPQVMKLPLLHKEIYFLCVVSGLVLLMVIWINGKAKRNENVHKNFFFLCLIPRLQTLFSRSSLKRNAIIKFNFFIPKKYIFSAFSSSTCCCCCWYCCSSPGRRTVCTQNMCVY